MVKWIGYSVYKADNPADPKHLADYWVADKGELIKFESAPKGKADVITLKSDGQSLMLDAWLRRARVRVHPRYGRDEHDGDAGHCGLARP